MPQLRSMLATIALKDTQCDKIARVRAPRFLFFGYPKQAITEIDLCYQLNGEGFFLTWKKSSKLQKITL